jgi:two-component system, chemotaxis family, protein-glutamate methylesterase/glutaminase
MPAGRFQVRWTFRSNDITSLMIDRPENPDPPPWLIVMGASAGGGRALEAAVAGFPPDLRACVLIVRHLSAETSAGIFARSLQNHCKLPCREARDGGLLEESQVILAAADRHLLVDGTRMWTTRGARENRWRPAIDPLFRSAAVSFRNRVIGVILSGSLDDGTSGLSAIKRCGGISIVQDPTDAMYPDMPNHAIGNVAIDHCVPASVMGGLIAGLVTEADGTPPPVPKDIEAEARIALSALSDPTAVAAIGTHIALTCPDCGGTLWQLDQDAFPRFRCHTGHAFSAKELIVAMDRKAEEVLWRALRMFEERRHLLKKVADAGTGHEAVSTDERLRLLEDDIARLRSLLARD